MSELRWILIGFGIILLAGIYLWGRRSSARAAAPNEPGTRARPEPGAKPSEAPLLGGDQSEITLEASASATPIDADERILARELALPEAAMETIERARSRLEPTFTDTVTTAELPVRSEASGPAPTLSSSEAPQTRRIERRKILSLRLSFTPQRVEGAKLLENLQSESLQHGKYQVFHRQHADGASIFSVASMVEPGTFELEKMGETFYSGITLFAQLPAPVPGMHALNELVACARRLQQSLGGTLQDERGVPLTVHRIERMRQEVREFERPPAGGGRGATSHSAHP
jgi:cell division protein ZipA